MSLPIAKFFRTATFDSIAGGNWQGCFDAPFSFTKDGGKEKKLEWIKKLNSIRNITHHEEKWPAKKEQVAFVQDIHKRVFERFIIPE